MINLIPPTAKRQVSTEYWVRVVSVWITLIASAFLITAVLLIPAFVLIQNQLAAYANKFSEASIQNEVFKEASETVSDANKISSLLMNEEESIAFTTLLDVLESLAGSKVVINSFNFSKEDDEIKNIGISGQAETRQALVAFSEALEANRLFKSAEIPLSNLAKDKDIPFTIQVIPAEPEE